MLPLYGELEGGACGTDGVLGLLVAQCVHVCGVHADQRVACLDARALSCATSADLWTKVYFLGFV